MLRDLSGINSQCSKKNLIYEFEGITEDEFEFFIDMLKKNMKSMIFYMISKFHLMT